MTIGAVEGRLEAVGADARTRALYAVRLVAVAAVYYGGAKLGLALSVAHGVITPVWPPTGIALASLVLFGRQMWPAVAVGAFLANATGGASIPVALALSFGNTLEAVIGYELLRLVRFRPSLERVRDVLALVILAGAASTAVAATNGVTALWIAGDLSDTYGSSWLLFWVGDAMGNLIVASLLLVVASLALSRRLPRVHVAEGATLLALLVGFSCFVFLAGYWRYPHVLFPLYIWAVLRFGQLGAVSSSFIVAAIAIAGAVGGETPLAHSTGTNVVLILEALLAGVTISVLLLGAVLAEHSRAEGELAEAQALARVGNWSWDVGTGRVSWSDELYRLVGLEPQSQPFDLDGYLGLLHPEDRERARRIIDRAYESGEPFAFDHRVFLPDGNLRWLHGRGRVLRNAAGEAVRMAGTAQDITERKQIDQLRDTILATVSHELRTPLTAIVGFAVTLKERALDDETRAAVVETLVAQARKLELLLTDLLDLERLRHGFVTPSLVETDVGRLVEQVVAAHTDGTHPIAFGGEAAPLVVDPPKIERIVDNLIANAVRHTPGGTAIEVRVEDVPEGVVIAVDDAGAGIPATERDAVFEPFRRGSDSGNRAGAGVGLSLVAQFAELHGGRVWVEQAPGGGAGFRVFLPRRIA
ncbi:MAG TPA: MASE1 domain-containing protein [Gaiellaceae bacterium]|nr:MASE1 domain-containing protein [Gaiellaceae bacterium]